MRVIRRILCIILFVSAIHSAKAQGSFRIILSNAADSTQMVAIFNKSSFVEKLYPPFKPFMVDAGANDTLYIMTKGYKTEIVTGSQIQSSTGIMDIHLTQLNVNLHEIRVHPMVQLDTLSARIKKLGIVPYELKPVYNYTNLTDEIRHHLPDVLWEKYNSLEREKRKVKKLMNEKDIHDIIVAYLDICNKQGIIDLPANEYDAFIEYTHITQQMLQQQTQYDVMNTIKGLYTQYIKHENGKN